MEKIKTVLFECLSTYKWGVRKLDDTESGRGDRRRTRRL